MKKLVILLFAILLFGNLLGQDIKLKTLPNGMQVATKFSDANETVALYCFVKTGSNTEGNLLGSGVSHYLEHIVSGGSTSTHTEDEYSDMQQEIGAMVNAYTTYNTTAFMTVVPAEFTDKGLEMLSEHIKDCAFDSTEVAREREVIIKEFVYRSSPPPVKARQRFMELAYPLSNQRYPVIGYIDLYKKLKRQNLVDYYNKHYVPNNMIFVAVGNMDADTLMTKIENSFADFERRNIEPVYQPRQTPYNGNFVYTEEFAIAQPMVMMTTILPEEGYQNTTALNMGLNILTGKRTSALQKKLVEELQLCNYVYGYANYMPGSAAQASIVYEAKNPAKLPEITAIIDQFIADYSEDGFEQEDIDDIVERNRAAMLLDTPNPEEQANGIGLSLQYYNVPELDEIQIKLMEQVTPQDIYDAFQKYLVPKNRVVFQALPINTKQMLEQSKEQAFEQTEIQKYAINNNLTLLFRRNTQKPLIRCAVNMPVYKNYGPLGERQRIDAMADMLLDGSRSFDTDEISDYLDDHSVDLSVRIGDTGSVIRIKSLRNDFEHTLEILGDALTRPEFPEKEIEQYMQRYKGSVERGKSWPDGLHGDFKSKTLYPGTSWGLTNQEELDQIKDLDQEQLQQLYKKYFMASNERPIVVAMVGDLTLSEAKSWAKEIYANIPKGTVNAQRQDRPQVPANDTTINSYPFEQVNISMYTAAPAMNDADADHMTMLNLILSGSSSSRLHKATRGSQDLAYYAYSNYLDLPATGEFSITTQTSMPKKDELISVLNQQLELLRTEPVTQQELDATLNDYDKKLSSMMSDDMLPYYAMYYEVNGKGFDYLKRMHEVLAHTTPQDIMDVANKYLVNPLIIISEPQEDMERELE